MDFFSPVILGRSGLKVGRLGISSSYGAPAEAFEEAFERGCNYFTYGTFIKGGSPEMCKAVRNITAKGLREKLVVAVITYAHWPWFTAKMLPRDLKRLGTDYADVLLLGYCSSPLDERTLEMASRLKETGLIRNLGATSHHRKVFPLLARQKMIDLFHVRYNAINRGAEKDVFPFLDRDDRPGVVSFTATRWGKLIDPKKTPPGKPTPSAVDAYRFVLSNPAVDVCMVGARNIGEMRDDFKVLDLGPLNEDELNTIRATGEYLYAH